MINLIFNNVKIINFPRILDDGCIGSWPDPSSLSEGAVTPDYLFHTILLTLYRPLHHMVHNYLVPLPNQMHHMAHEHPPGCILL